MQRATKILLIAPLTMTSPLSVFKLCYVAHNTILSIVGEDPMFCCKSVSLRGVMLQGIVLLFLFYRNWLNPKKIRRYAYLALLYHMVDRDQAAVTYPNHDRHKINDGAGLMSSEDRK